MNSARLIVPPQNPVIDNNGQAVAGALAYFYEPGTQTPVPLYSNQNLTAPLEQPVVADGSGLLPNAWIDETQAPDLVIYRPDGSQVFDLDAQSGLSFANGSTTPEAASLSYSEKETKAAKASGPQYSMESELSVNVHRYDEGIASFAGKSAPNSTVVGTTDEQTLTNKTLTSPVISSPSGLAKGDVGLGNVDNTADADKPISTATQAALDDKQPLDATLTALAGLDASEGLVEQTGPDAFAKRSIGTAADADIPTKADVVALIGTTGIPDGSVTNAELADMAAATLKGRGSGAGTGTPVDLSASQAAAIVRSELIENAITNGETNRSPTSDAVFDALALKATTSSLGTAATQNTGTSGATVPLLNASNTWGGVQAFDEATANLIDVASGVRLTQAGVEEGYIYAGGSGRVMVSWNRQSAGNDRYLDFQAAGTVANYSGGFQAAGNFIADNGIDKSATLSHDGALELQSSSSVIGPYIDLKRSTGADFEARLYLHPGDGRMIINQNALSGAPPRNQMTTSYWSHSVHSDEIDQMASAEASAGLGKVQGFTLYHSFGAEGDTPETATASGGRDAFAAYLHHLGPTKEDGELAADRNYCGLVGYVRSDEGDGGTGTTLATARGAYFGGNFYARLEAGAVNVMNATGAEFNPESLAGSTCRYWSGIQINGRRDGGRGAEFDAMISLSDISGDTRWRHGVLFSNANGLHPVGADGTLIGSVGTATVANGIDFSSYEITGSLVKGDHVDISGDGHASLVSAALTRASEGYALDIANTLNDPDAKGLRITTTWGTGLGRVIEAYAAGTELFRVDGAISDAVWIMVGGSLRKLIVDGSNFIKAA